MKKLGILILLLVLLGGCVSPKEQTSDSEVVQFESIYQTALQYNLEIRKSDVLKNFYNEYQNARTFSKLFTLQNIIKSPSYTLDIKTNLLLQSLNNGILYNLLALNHEKQESIADFYSRNQIRYELEKLMYRYYFFSNLEAELVSKYGILESEKSYIKNELDLVELNYLALVGSLDGLKNYKAAIASEFYQLPKNILLKALNSRPYFPSSYNRDFIKIADKIMLQMPPYGNQLENAVRFNEILFKVPSELYKNYHDDSTIQFDSITIFSVIAFNFELQLTLNNIKNIEQQYTLKKHEYSLLKNNQSNEKGKKFFEFKLLELARFEAFLFLQHFINGNGNINIIKQQEIPANIAFLLEKIALDIIGSAIQGVSL